MVPKSQGIWYQSPKCIISQPFSVWEAPTQKNKNKTSLKNQLIITHSILNLTFWEVIYWFSCSTCGPGAMVGNHWLYMQWKQIHQSTFDVLLMNHKYIDWGYIFLCVETYGIDQAWYRLTVFLEISQRTA